MMELFTEYTAHLNTLLDATQRQQWRSAEQTYRFLEGEMGNLSPHECLQLVESAALLWAERLIPQAEYSTALAGEANLRQVLKEKLLPGHSIVREEREGNTTYYWVPNTPTSVAESKAVLASNVFPTYELSHRKSRQKRAGVNPITDPALLSLLNNYQRVAEKLEYHNWVKGCLQKWLSEYYECSSVTVLETDRVAFYRMAAQLLLNRGYVLSDDILYPEQNAGVYFQKTTQKEALGLDRATLISEGELEAQRCVLTEQVKTVETAIAQLNLETRLSDYTVLLQNLTHLCSHRVLALSLATKLKLKLSGKFNSDHYTLALTNEVKALQSQFNRILSDCLSTNVSNGQALALLIQALKELQTHSSVQENILTKLGLSFDRTAWKSMLQDVITKIEEQSQKVAVQLELKNITPESAARQQALYSTWLTALKQAKTNAPPPPPSVLESKTTSPEESKKEYRFEQTETQITNWLQAVQQQLDQNVPVSEIHQTNTCFTHEVLTPIIHDCERILGPAPCAFAIIGLGSYARIEISVCSDIDFAILLQEESQRHHVYFQALVLLLQFKLRFFQEHVFELESGDISSLLGEDKPMIHTPEEMVREHLTDSPSTWTHIGSYSARNAQLITASRTHAKESVQLLPQYHERLQDRFEGKEKEIELTRIPVEQRGQRAGVAPNGPRVDAQGFIHNVTLHFPPVDGLEVMEEKGQPSVPVLSTDPRPLYQKVAAACLESDFRKDMDTLTSSEGAAQIKTISIKQTLLKPINLWLMGLKVYYNLNATSPRAILSELQTRNILSPAFVNDVTHVLDYAHRLRLKLHLTYLTQADKPAQANFDALLIGEASNPNHAVFHHSSEQAGEWTTFQWQVLTPIRNSIQQWVQHHVLPPGFDPLMHTYELLFEKFKERRDIESVEIKAMAADMARILVHRSQCNLAFHNQRFERLPEALRLTYWQALKKLFPQDQYPLLTQIAYKADPAGQRLETQIRAFEWQARLTDLCESKAEAKDSVKVEWIEKNQIITAYFRPEVATQFLSAGCFKPKDKDQAGNHRVYPVCWRDTIVWLKLFPEQPSTEGLVCYLDAALGCFGTPVGQLLKIYQPSDGKGYAMHASQHSIGQTLDAVLKTSPKELEKLSFASWGSTLLRVLLTNPEDDKGDDYFLVPTSSGCYTLHRIDNERAFFQPFAKKKLQVKSVLYCMDEMTLPLSNTPEGQAVIDHFLKLEPLSVVGTLLDYLSTAEPFWKKLFRAC